MPRSNGTQTRTFVYTGVDLTSATNPENGTVTYGYDASHHVTKRTDAMGQETRYTYDDYGRLTEVQHRGMAWNPGTNSYQFQEWPFQRVDYHFDNNPLDGSYSQYAWGRLAAVSFRDGNTGFPLEYMYSYNQAGRVTSQRMDYDYAAQVFDAAYTWDTEGRMTTIDYGPKYQMQFDVNGRLSGMQDMANGNAAVAPATYGVAGEMSDLSYFGHYETRKYNSMLQMTRITGGMMDMQYVYAAGANNGRITQAIDGVGGETVNYTYDALNRLASATAGTWGQGFSINGAGELAACGTANPKDAESFRQTRLKTYHDRALAIVRPKGIVGTATVRVQADAFPPDTVVVQIV